MNTDAERPSPDADSSTSRPAAAPTGAPTRSAAEQVIVARAGRYYRNARYIMVALVVGFGIYFLYDGFIGYPAKNEAERQKPENLNERGEFIGKLPHSEWDILLQKILGFALPPLGLAYLGFILYRSRGEYRLEGTTLHLPGHPPFELDDVIAVDRKLWDRKGIAKVTYQTPQGVTGTATLDDFIYERKPTDQIYDAIIANMNERSQGA
ncbi:MAG: hypothetical protein ACK4PI_13220 [Tepidisphaerales bacterium]